MPSQLMARATSTALMHLTGALASTALTLAATLFSSVPNISVWNVTVMTVVTVMTLFNSGPQIKCHIHDSHDNIEFQLEDIPSFEKSNCTSEHLINIEDLNSMVVMHVRL
jgi:hypothetical protein